MAGLFKYLLAAHRKMFQPDSRSGYSLFSPLQLILHIAVKMSFLERLRKTDIREILIGVFSQTLTPCASLKVAAGSAQSQGG